MNNFQLAWNPLTRVATAQAIGAALPPGSVKLSDEIHNHPTDPVGSGRTHVLFHHVQRSLYRYAAREQNMQTVKIVADVNIMVRSISVTPPAATLAPLATRQLTVTFDPANTVNQVVNWVSHNPAVATVSNTGLVTAVANGDTVIECLATDNLSITDTCRISVRTPVTLISCLPATVPLAVGATQQIATTFTPATASIEVLHYTTSAPAVATCDSDGLITAHAVGTATITVTSDDGGHIDTVVVTVT